jgi:DNA polymerase elongation subunit (family B)
MKKTKIINFIFIITFTLIATTIFAQKDSDKLIDKDPVLQEAMKQNNYNKGVINYNVMKGVFHNTNVQQVKFNVEVQTAQNVMIEVFNEEGELIQVVYNDLLTAENPMPVTVNGDNWDKNKSYYIRVTTNNFIENHEVIFE